MKDKNQVVDKDALLEYVGTLLRAARDRRDYSREEVSDRTGLDTSTLYHIEHGHGCTLHSFMILCKVLDVRPDEILPPLPRKAD